MEREELWDLWYCADVDGLEEPTPVHARVPVTVVADPKQERPGDWLTASEAADYLRLVSVDALYQRCARGQTKAYRLGRQLRFRRRDLDALMRAA